MRNSPRTRNGSLGLDYEKLAILFGVAEMIELTGPQQVASCPQVSEQ